MGDGRVADDLEGAVALDGADAVLLDVAGDDAGERAAQVGGELVHRLVAVQAQGAHRGVGHLEGPLELGVDAQQPVVVVGVGLAATGLAHGLDAAVHDARDLGRVVDDDADALERGGAERAGEEGADALEVFRARARTGEHQRERLRGVRRVEQDAEQVEDLLGGADAAREHDEAVRHAHEGLEPLLDVGQDHEVVDDGVRRLGGDDAGLGEADVAAADDALLGVADGRALHRALHGARAAAGADIEAAQAELVADLLGVLVFDPVDGVAAPAHDQVRPQLVAHQPRVAQDVEHGVGDGLGLAEIEAAALDDLVGGVDDVAQHREQQLLGAADHLPVDEGHRGRVLDLELDAEGVANELDVEVAVALEDGARVVGVAAGVEHGERAAAEERIEAALPAREQLLHLLLRERLERAARRDARVDGLGDDDAGLHGGLADGGCGSGGDGLRAGCRSGCWRAPAARTPSCRRW